MAAFQDPPLAQRFKQRKLMIVELRKCDGFRVPVKLLVLLLVGHLPTLRGILQNQSALAISTLEQIDQLPQLSLIKIGHGPVTHFAVPPMKDATSAGLPQTERERSRNTRHSFRSRRLLIPDDGKYGGLGGRALRKRP